MPTMKLPLPFGDWGMGPTLNDSEKAERMECSYTKIFQVLKDTVLTRCQTPKSKMLLEVIKYVARRI